MYNTFVNWAIPFLCTTTVSLAAALIKRIVRERRADKSAEKLVEDGIQCLLRAEIIRQHDKWLAREYCPIYAKEALKREYHVYEGLHGNDVGEQMFKQLMELPTSPPHTRPECVHMTEEY